MLRYSHTVWSFLQNTGALFDEDVDTVMRGVCIEIEDRYQMKFLEIGTGKDHVHFLVQSIPNLRRDQNSIDS